MSKFYEDPVYIDMCRKAKGDLPIHLGEIPISHQYEAGDYFYSESMECGMPYCSPYGAEWPHKVDTWLPRLDQLIEMVDFMDSIKHFQSFSCYSRETFWILNVCSVYDQRSIEVDGLTIEQCWLKLIMLEKYNKHWTGSEWVEI